MSCTEMVVLRVELMAGEVQEGAEVEAEEIQEEEVLWR